MLHYYFDLSHVKYDKLILSYDPPPFHAMSFSNVHFTLVINIMAKQRSALEVPHPTIPTISNRIITVRMQEKFPKLKEKLKVDPAVSLAKKPWYVRSFIEFCNATALHGYSYIVKPNTALWER